jgi:hypothetical protein
MPDREVKTIRELIYYQYSKIIVKSALGLPDGMEAKGRHYGFVKSTFKGLKYGMKSWSDIIREDRQLMDSDSYACAYCGREDGIVEWEHIVPKSLSIKLECAACDTIQAVHNQVRACPSCNSHKGKLGLYEFYKKSNPDNLKFYDIIPRLIEKKYLKTIYNCHECAGTLDKGDIDGDGVLTVLDIDYILR